MKHRPIKAQVVYRVPKFRQSFNSENVRLINICRTKDARIAELEDVKKKLTQENEQMKADLANIKLKVIDAVSDLF